MERDSNEATRLEVLRLYRILDTASEQSFDDLTKLAAAICGVPISLISLVDESRQWFKSRVGLKVSETPRDFAFCAHTIRHGEMMIVEDALQDARFATNPLVVGEPKIRFYAGAPLEVSGGHRLGTLCVIDRRPRLLDTYQIEALRVLSVSVATQLELRRTVADLKTVGQLLPLCAWCRSVRTSSGEGDAWTPLHEFVSESTPVTHTICPDCSHKAQPGASPETTS